MRKAIIGLSLTLLLTGAAFAEQVLTQQTITTGSGTSRKVVTTQTTTLNGQPVTIERTETVGIDGLPVITERTYSNSYGSTMPGTVLTTTPVMTTPGMTTAPMIPLGSSTTSTSTTTTTHSSSSSNGVPLTVIGGSTFYYPPYQLGLDQPVRLSYALPGGAQSVRVNVSDLTTGRTSTYTLMPVAGTDRYEAMVPMTDFSRGDRLQITYQPLDLSGMPFGTSQSVTYVTLQDPSFYQAQTFDADPDLLIVPFQDKAANGPAFNVYWPELYYAKKAPYPLAARVSSSRAPQNSIRKLDPIAGRPGWFQFQVPSLWYEPGETITVDFTTENQQAFNRDSDYPLDANAQFIPLDRVMFQTAQQ